MDAVFVKRKYTHTHVRVCVCVCVCIYILVYAYFPWIHKYVTKKIGCEKCGKHKNT